MALICDTGPLLAALDAADPDHEACAHLLTSSSEDLVVPTLVLAELDYWCHTRLSVLAWLTFLEDLLEGVYRLAHPTMADLARCAALQQQYADLEIGVVDASVIALVERLGETKVASLDHRHLATVRPIHADSVTLLP